ncbi:MAG: response regulator transcription factor [Acidobacteria bacterium]|nr:response regulator transcription factor [Acidobacteriota bacterium]
MAFRILIADDHEIVRRGLKAILSAQGDWEVVGEALTGREAVEQTRERKPDIVIMDIGMPDLNGLEATRQILKEFPGIEVLILTMHESEQLIREVLDTGARGYVLKSDAGRDLVAAVDALRRHKPYFTTKVSEMVLTGYLRGVPSREEPEDAPRLRLTGREREIVQLLAEGKSNKEVASSLNISVKTAETHRARIMAKLGLRSIGELVRYAVRNGMVEP